MLAWHELLTNLAWHEILHRHFRASQSLKWITAKWLTHGKQLQEVALWGKLETPPPRDPFQYILNLEASLHSLLSFAWASLTQQINCDKILFSHSPRWTDTSFFFLTRFLNFSFFCFFFNVILLLLIFTKIMLLLLFFLFFFCFCFFFHENYFYFFMFRDVPAPGFIDALRHDRFSMLEWNIQTFSCQLCKLCASSLDSKS